VATYTLKYDAIATWLGAGAMATALAAAPRDTKLEATLDLTLVSDSTVATTTGAERTIVYQSNAASPVKDPEMAQVLTGIWRGVFSAYLVMPVSAQPVVVT
jgi:hypothetical protein